MKKLALLLAVLLALSGCASSIVNGEYLRTSQTNYPPKPEASNVDIFLSGKSPSEDVIDIGKVSARAYVLEKGMDELKLQARKIGAEAITNVSYERKMSIDYLQDLYFLNGDAVIYK